MKEKRLREIFERFVKHANQDEDKGESVFADFGRHIEAFFDELAEEDYFGTEMQCHPFGDKRS